MRQLTTTIVTVPAASTLLTDLNTVKLQLNITTGDTTYDAWINSAIQRGSAAIQTYCNRIFAQQTYQDIIWLQNDAYPYQVPGNVAPLQLSTYPITSPITSCIVTQGAGVTQTLTEGQDFITDQVYGQLIRLNIWTSFPTNWDSAPTTVVFQGGYATVPYDIVEAVLRWIAGAYAARSRDPYLKEIEQPGLGRKVYWVDTSTPESHFTPDIAELLDKYRVPSVW